MAQETTIMELKLNGWVRLLLPALLAVVGAGLVTWGSTKSAIAHNREQGVKNEKQGEKNEQATDAHVGTPGIHQTPEEKRTLIHAEMLALMQRFYVETIRADIMQLRTDLMDRMDRLERKVK